MFLFHTLAAAVLSGPVVIFVPCVLVLAPVVVGVVVVCVVVLGGGGGGHCDVCVDQLIHGFSASHPEEPPHTKAPNGVRFKRV